MVMVDLERLVAENDYQLDKLKHINYFTISLI